MLLLVSINYRCGDTAALALRCANGYCKRMRSRKVRRLLNVLLALVLTTGLATHHVQAGDMSTKAATVGMDMPADKSIPGNCDGCCDDQKAPMPSACVAFCNSVVVMPVMAVVVVPVSIDTLWPTAEVVATGHTSPPEPYPPRPIVLS